MGRVVGTVHATGGRRKDDATPNADQTRSKGARPSRSSLPDLSFDALLEFAPDAIVIVDEGGLIQFVNGRAEQMFGYSQEEMIGQAVELLVPDGKKGLHRQHRERYMTAPKSRPMGVGLDLAARTKDGGTVPVEISLTPLPTDDRLLVVGVIRDVSSRRRLEKAALSARAIAAQEQERVRVARDLHDEVAQALSGIALGLEQIESAPRLETARNEARRLAGEVRTAMRELRRVVEHLRPDDLANIGLVDALERMAEDRQASSPGIAIVFRSHGNGRRFDLDSELAAYRVVQEAVTNAVKHAGPSKIEIDLTTGEDATIARVRDDGCGFNVEDVPTEGLGLDGMRERALLVRGELKIDSAPGRGTEVSLRLPPGAR